MTSRCDICVDPVCDGKQKCNCDACDKKEKCYRVLSPTIRITTKCTQSCRHCCFSCSPNRDDFMSLEKAHEINGFLVSNNINYANIMGGEFFVHPDWFEVMSALCKGIKFVRVVTNGDWVGIEDDRVRLFADRHPVYFAISKDRWHSNKNVDAAVKFCLDHNILHKVASKDQTKEDSIVPIGRAQFEYNFYSIFGQYCRKPDRKYSFLIDEGGTIFKCPLGIWDYANVSEYVSGGFAERFKEFTTIFYSEFIPNCASCQRAWNRANDMRRKNEDVATI